MQKLPLLLASLLLTGGAMQLRAEEVTLTTALPTGENLQLALNADLRVELAWGNGETQTFVSDGSLQSIPVLDANLTISSLSGRISSLYLQGDSLTALDVTEAPNLAVLLAADNQLTSIDLSSSAALVTLDLQGNKLTSLTASAAAGLKELNVASNQLTSSGVTLASATRPTHFVTANNQITSNATTTLLRAAKTVWVQNNKISSLRLTYSTDLHSVCAFNNQLTSIVMPSSTNMLTDLWVDNNQIESIDMSGGAPLLYSLAANDNQLSEIVWDDTRRRATEYVYIQNNALFINSMPTIRSLENYCIAPQSDYQLSEDYYDLNTAVDFSDLLSRNGWNVSNASTLSYVLTDIDGTELVSGTDYTESSRKFTFLTGHRGVQLKVSSTSYPDMTFVTSAFNVGIPAGIDNVTTAKGITVSGQRGALRIVAPEATTVSVYNAAGERVANGQMSQGTHTFALPAGVYVANGKKVIVY